MVRLFATSLVAGLANAVQFTETSQEQSLEKTWSAELEGKTNPIKRVINLLNDMKAQLEKEASKEAEMYDEMVCWCETNEKEKVKAIADAEAKDKDLSAEIESRAARFGSVSTEIEAMKKQIAEDTEALKQATAIREKEAGAFRGNEKDMVQAITNLKNAVAVLKKHQGGDSNKISGTGFIQMDASLMSSLRSVLRDVSFKYEMMMAAQATPEHESALLQMKSGLDKDLMATLGSSSAALPVEFAQRILERTAGQNTGPGFLQATEKQPLYESRSSASGAIFGILTQMLEEFEKNLSTSQKDEIKGKEDYEALAAAKAVSIETGKAKLDAMEAEDAANAKALSDAKEDLELTRKQRSADVEFLRNLRVTCQNLDREWEARSKTRSQEILAVSEALEIITGDDNREMLYKSTSFLQTSEGTEMQMRRNKAVATLRSAAQAPSFDADDLLDAWHNRRSPSLVSGPRAQLSTLAVTVQLDSFTKVKEAMDKMVADLKKEQQEEVDLKAFCTKEFNQNEKETYDNTEQKEDLEAKMDELAALIKKLGEEIAEAQGQIAETDLGVKKASQTRESQNAEFQVTVSDQRATQAILTKALDRLKAFYKKAEGGGAAFVQQGQTPPVQFNKFKKNAGASPVIGMIEQIIEDSKATEADAISTEREAQANYETFVKDSNNLVAELTDSVTAKTKSIASSKVEAEDAKSDHISTVEELELLAQHNAELHGQCDFVLSNFDIRQKARLQEIEAIGEAKAILSGAK
jgi:hypothetical protein